MIAAVISTIIFVLCLGLILAEKMHRTIIAIACAALMAAAGRWLGFYSEAQALRAVDFNTLGVLLGMMILVALLEPTGFFQYVAVQAGRLSRGHPARLLFILGAFTTLLSMFLDNVTTVVLIAPVTILISEVIGVSPAPFLIAEALLSNTGGAATLIGDPPNIMIGSAAKFSFSSFLIHSLPVVLISWLAAVILLRSIFRRELRYEENHLDAVMQLDAGETLKDIPTARRVLIVLGMALLVFLGHNFLGITPAFVALSAAAVALVWVQPSVQSTLARIDWSVLLFFIALFVVVGGLEAAGVLASLALMLKRMAVLHPAALGVLMIWLSAGLSAVVDNVPITIALIPIIEDLGLIGVNITPLWWALVFGAGFGGNGTIIGSTANIIVVGFSEKTRVPITSKMWLRSGLPVMLLTCAIASVFYLLAYPLFTR